MKGNISLHAQYFLALLSKLKQNKNYILPYVLFLIQKTGTAGWEVVEEIFIPMLRKVMGWFGLVFFFPNLNSLIE